MHIVASDVVSLGRFSHGVCTYSDGKAFHLDKAGHQTTVAVAAVGLYCPVADPTYHSGPKIGEVETMGPQLSPSGALTCWPSVFVCWSRTIRSIVVPAEPLEASCVIRNKHQPLEASCVIRNKHLYRAPQEGHKIA